MSVNFRAIPATVATIVAALMTSHATGLPFSGTPAPHPTPGITTAQDASDQPTSEAPEPGTAAGDPAQPNPASPAAPSDSTETDTTEEGATEEGAATTESNEETTPAPDADPNAAGATDATTPLDRAQKSWREQLGILEQPEGTPRDGSASQLAAPPSRFAPRNVRPTGMHQCTGRGFYSMSSGKGEINFLYVNSNGTLGSELVGRVEWKKDTGAGRNLGYDGLAIAADGSMWHTELRGSTQPGSTPETWIAHGRISNTGDTGYQLYERYRILGPGMPIKGGTMSPDGKYLTIGDTATAGTNYKSKRKLMAFDPGTRRMVTLGYLNTTSLSSAVFSDMIFDKDGNLYILSGSSEGRLNNQGRDFSGLSQMRIDRIDAADFQAAYNRAIAAGQFATANNAREPIINLNSIRNKNFPELPTELVRSFHMNLMMFEPDGLAAGPNGSFYVSGRYTGQNPSGRLSQSRIYEVDIISGEVRNRKQPVFQVPASPGDYNGQWADTAISDTEGCAELPTISAEKNITKRLNERDQFTVTVAEKNPGTNPLGGAPYSESVTTTGQADGPQTPTRKMLRGRDRVYVLKEQMAGGSASSLSDYNKVWSCTDKLGRNVQVRGQREEGGAFLGEVTSPPVNGNLTCSVLNSPKVTSLTIQKQDADYGDPLAGAVFDLCEDANGNGRCDAGEPRQGERTTDGSGRARWDNVLIGRRYVVDEKSAPRGYRPAGTPQVVTTKQQNPPVIIKNDRVRGTIVWEKKETGSEKFLKGSVWTVRDQHGRPFEVSDCVGETAQACPATRLWQDQDPRPGKLRLENVPWGTYTLEEKTAPLGYVKTTEVKTVEVGATTVTNDRNEPVELNLGAIYNKLREAPPLPLTGGWSDSAFRTAGFAVLGGAVLLVSIVMIRRRNRG
ncbi:MULTISPECIES: MSCRAMM family protein [Actinotignum]|uniref:MSCRAMM family protein n=1 Tax=Actinotignum TaxID=1653174 RepID=UPI00254CD121|nr:MULTISPECIES: prealbumin-like fold domain-containing protein [Actinotignum]MDK7270890.1 SpaA isopeptide-forming pilin-related protein [Actinotignum schaalii]MDY5143813.1 SpaA isopeptide-forming pilin-related protein [Actinotignum timonense]